MDSSSKATCLFAVIVVMTAIVLQMGQAAELVTRANQEVARIDEEVYRINEQAIDLSKRSGSSSHDDSNDPKSENEPSKAEVIGKKILAFLGSVFWFAAEAAIKNAIRPIEMPYLAMKTAAGGVAYSLTGLLTMATSPVALSNLVHDKFFDFKNIPVVGESSVPVMKGTLETVQSPQEFYKFIFGKIDYVLAVIKLQEPFPKHLLSGDKKSPAANDVGTKDEH